MEVLKQGKSAPVAVEKQVAILYAVINNVLTDVEPGDIAEYEAGLYDFLDSNSDGSAAMDAIRTSGALSEDTEGKLKNALKAYTDRFIAQKK